MSIKRIKMIFGKIMEPPRRLATDDEFCAFTGLTKQQSAQLRYLGQGPRFIRVTGRQIRYAWTDIEEWCERRTVSRSDQRGALPAPQANEPRGHRSEKGSPPRRRKTAGNTARW